MKPVPCQACSRNFPLGCAQHPNGPSLWAKMVLRARSPRWKPTFRQVYMRFLQLYKVKPDTNWPMMPLDTADWFRKVVDVPKERLHA